MKYKILLVDDEPDILAMLSSFFLQKGYDVLTARDAASAFRQVEQAPDIILPDINMPGTNGLEVCGRIRDHVACPILFLTARIEDADKVKGFSAGGDDYILKPAGSLTIDFIRRCLSCQDCQIPLTKKEFDILALLAGNPGQVFDRERIYERIWGYDSDGDSSVVAQGARQAGGMH